MTFSPWLWILLLPAALIVLQLRSALGSKGAWLAGMLVLIVVGGGWLVLVRNGQMDILAPGQAPQGSVLSDTCFKCHEDHYASWQRTYHRTMTREAGPQT